MKKFLKLLVFSIITFIPLNVFASGGITVAPSNILLTEGASASFKIVASNAAGKITVSSSDTTIASVNKSSFWIENETVTVTVKGLKIGSTNIVVSYSDVATFDGEEVKGSKKISVNVQEKTTKTTTIDTRNKDNSLKSISVDGYTLNKIDEHEYTLDVSNSVTSINISASANDSKATVTGTGSKELNVGENNFEVIITAENQSKNKINIKITRKDGYYLNDIDEVLANNDTNISVILNDNNVTNDTLNKIKTSGKTIELCKYDDSKNLLYSWNIDGSKLSNLNDFNTNVSFINDDYTSLKSKTNYVEGLYLNYDETNNIPDGITLKLNVSSLYKNGDVLNLYSYDNNEFSLIQKNLSVKDGFIEYEVSNLNNTLITAGILNSVSNISKTSNINIYLIITIIELLIIIILIVLYILKCKKVPKN